MARFAAPPEAVAELIEIVLTATSSQDALQGHPRRARPDGPAPDGSHRAFDAFF